MMMNKSYEELLFVYDLQSLPLQRMHFLWLLCEWAARKECEDWMDGLSLLLQWELFVEDWHQVVPVDGYHRIQNPDIQMASFLVG